MIEQVWPDRSGFVAPVARTCIICEKAIDGVTLETKKGPCHPGCGQQVREEDWPELPKFFDLADELDRIIDEANRTV